MNPIEWAKQNPIPTTLIVVVGGIVFFFIVSGSGGTAVSSTTISGPTDAQVQADAQLNALRIQQADNASERQTQVELGKYQRDIELAQAQASLDAIENTNQTNVAIETIRSTRDQKLAAINYDEAVRGYQAQETVAKYAYDTNANQTAAQLEATRLNTQAAVTVQTINNQTALQIADINSKTTLGTAEYNRTLELEKLASAERINTNTVKGAIDLANIQSNTQTKIAQIESNTAISTTKSNNSAKKTSSIFGAIGSIAGAIGSIFSDERLKDNITKEGVDPETGLPMYSYTMNGEWHLGYMAQDIALKYPKAIRRGPGDSMMYDPRLLN